MPRKLSTIRALSLLPMLAILFIGLGMPVIHPALHDHAGIHNHSGDRYHNGTSLVCSSGSGDCPICTFLANNHLRPVDKGLLVASRAGIPFFLPEPTPATGQSGQFLPESRAPPSHIS